MRERLVLQAIPLSQLSETTEGSITLVFNGGVCGRLFSNVKSNTVRNRSPYSRKWDAKRPYTACHQSQAALDHLFPLVKAFGEHFAFASESFF
jgi:hypothetical protein